MSAEHDLHAALMAAPGVTSLVASRIYPDVAAENALLPLLVYERRGTDYTSTIDDGSPVAAKVALAVSAWATSRLAAEQLADAVIAATAIPAEMLNRFGHSDDPSGAFAAVVELAIWEV